MHVHFIGRHHYIAAVLFSYIVVITTSESSFDKIRGGCDDRDEKNDDFVIFAERDKDRERERDRIRDERERERQRSRSRENDNG